MRRLFVVAGLALLAVPRAGAQNPQKGTWELGGFGRFNWYDNAFNTVDSTRRKNSWGGGGRIGYFLAPKWSLEFDGSFNATDMDFPAGATSIGLRYLPFHLGINYEAPLSTKFSWLVGPRINYNVYSTTDDTSPFTGRDYDGTDWGVGGITGFRYKFSETWSARLDGTIDWIPSPISETEDHTNTMMGLQLGLSAFLGGKCRDKLDSIRVEPKSQNIMVGDRAGFRVTGFECDGDVIDVTGASTARITSGQGTLAAMSFTATQAGCVDVEISNPAARRRSTDTARICAQERQAPPVRVTLDRCELTPSTANVPPGETMTFRVTGFYSDGTSRELETATLNADGGTITGRQYTVPMAPGTYTVVAQCGDGRAARATITVRALTVTIRAMFGIDQATLANQVEVDSLRFLAEELKKYPNLQLTIHGHTDWTGSVAYNERLGMRRIQAVLDTLANHGIDRARMDTWTKISYGECQPLADNRTRDGRAQNRRVTIHDSRSAQTYAGGARCEERP